MMGKEVAERAGYDDESKMRCQKLDQLRHQTLWLPFGSAQDAIESVRGAEKRIGGDKQDDETTLKSCAARIKSSKYLKITSAEPGMKYDLAKSEIFSFTFKKGKSGVIIKRKATKGTKPKRVMYASDEASLSTPSLVILW